MIVKLMLLVWCAYLTSPYIHTIFSLSLGSFLFAYALLTLLYFAVIDYLTGIAAS